MRQITSVAGTFRAHVLAARLAAEGIDAHLGGGIHSQYALTVGDLARVEVWVPEDQLEDAREVLLFAEVDAVLAAPSDWAGAPMRAFPRRWLRWTAAAVLAAAGLVPVLVWVNGH